MEKRRHSTQKSKNGQNGKRNGPDEEEEFDPKVPVKTRKCEKTGCLADMPICILGSAELCSRNRYTSRWFHITAGEHLCNECYENFYRSHKHGYQQFIKWKQVWCKHGKADSNFKMFVADQMLPFWLQCHRCSKWRQIFRNTDVTPEFVKTFACGAHLKTNKSQEELCRRAEDFRVDLTQTIINPASLCAPSFMIGSITAPYMTPFFPDGVGLSPSDTSIHNFPLRGTDINKYLHPFHMPGEPEQAMSLPPDFMTTDEETTFPEFYHEAIVKAYLSTRNTLITIWNLNVKEWVTVERASPHLICRGLTRVRLMKKLHNIISYLTRKGFINIGLLSAPPNVTVCPSLEQPKEPIIVIGAGAAGLAVARQLSNFGLKVIVLEARLRVGGRVMDDESLGRCVGKGTQIVNGCNNNPILIMCKQADLETVELTNDCPVLDCESGSLIETNLDKSIGFHFNSWLDRIEEWGKSHSLADDVSLKTKLEELKNASMDEMQMKFTKDELQLLLFQLSNLEYASGGRLDKLSAKNWNQNEAFPQFSGAHARIKDGYSQILDKLATGINLVTNMQVSSIDYTGSEVRVRCTTGKEWMASKVVLTVPLALLKENRIEFNPPLPESKLEAIRDLGVGKIEKIVMKFSEKFWMEASDKQMFFGRGLQSDEEYGFFNSFFDLSDQKNNILGSFITGAAVDWMKDVTDEEIMQRCFNQLQKLFSKKNVEAPEKYFVTRWCEDKYSQMSFSYIPVGVDGSVYDRMGESVAKKLFFAGEATNRQFPQTVTGAYLSGIREADKILSDLLDKSS